MLRLIEFRRLFALFEMHFIKPACLASRVGSGGSDGKPGSLGSHASLIVDTRNASPAKSLSRVHKKADYLPIISSPGSLRPNVDATSSPH